MFRPIQNLADNKNLFLKIVTFILSARKQGGKEKKECSSLSFNRRLLACFIVVIKSSSCLTLVDPYDDGIFINLFN